RQPVQPAGVPTFIGIDYHKAYSVYCVLDAQVSNLERGRIDHARPHVGASMGWMPRGFRSQYELALAFRDSGDGAILRTHRVGESLQDADH
ncbi:MAG: hypothetical protein ABW214_04960, partial [Terrimicrobiaceae bacterium]